MSGRPCWKKCRHEDTRPGQNSQLVCLDCNAPLYTDEGVPILDGSAEMCRCITHLKRRAELLLGKDGLAAAAILLIRDATGELLHAVLNSEDGPLSDDEAKRWLMGAFDEEFQ